MICVLHHMQILCTKQILIKFISTIMFTSISLELDDAQKYYTEDCSFSYILIYSHNTYLGVSLLKSLLSSRLLPSPFDLR